VSVENKTKAAIAGGLLVGSWLAWLCGGVILILVALGVGVLMLSSFYKSRINSMKQAPFSVPNWAPPALFPRDYSFYYEYEISIRDKDTMEIECNNLESYLR